MIEYLDLQKDNKEYIEKTFSSIKKKFKTKKYFILDSFVKTFENNFKKYIGSNYAVGVNSGTDALIIALRALGIKSGDEVILPSLTASATAISVLNVNATPVFADIEEDFLTIDPKEVEKKITNKTKAIIVVHLYGQSCNISAINKIAKKHNLKIIEDCAQSTGTKLKNKHTGTFGHISCHSFYPTKNLGAIGDGGMILTNDKVYFDQCIKLRQYGWDKKRDIKKYGINSRLDEFQSLFLNEKLSDIDNILEKKRAIVANYMKNLDNKYVEFIQERPESMHSYHIFAIKVPASKRNKLIRYLKNNGVYTAVHYNISCHQLKIFNNKYKLPITEKVSKKLISLPISLSLKNNQMKNICSKINEFFLKN